MSNVIILSLIAGLFFGTWPALMRTSHLSVGWAMVMIGSGILLVGVVVLKNTFAPLPTTNQIILGFIAGLMEGLGMIAYTRIIGTPSIQISQGIPLTAILAPTFAVITGLLIFSESITIHKLLGLLMAAFAIVLLV